MGRSALRLLVLAWPVVLSRLGIMGMGLCDLIVTGQLAPDELAYQALGWAPNTVVLVAGIGLLTGVQVLAARAIGAGMPEEAGGTLRRGLIVSFVSSALAIGVTYALGEHVFAWFGVESALVPPSARVMRVLMLSVPLHLFYVCGSFFVEAIERPMASTWVMAAANVVNLGLNLLFVPRYGAIGSAWATVGARLFLAVTLLWWIYRLPDATRLGLRWRSPGPSFREFLGVGTAAALSSASEAGAFASMTIIAGRLGAQEVSAYQIVVNLLAVVFMAALGLSTATAVLTAQAIGRNNPREAVSTSWLGLGINTCFMLGIAGLIWIFAWPIARAYTTALDVVQLVAAAMPLAAAAVVPDGGQGVTAAALRAQGDNWFPTASHVLSYAIVMPALGLMLAETQGLGVRGLLLAITWSSFLSVGLLMLRLGVLTRRAQAPLVGAGHA